MQPIHRAAWDGDVAALDRLVAEDGELLNALSQVELCTPLMLAACRGQDAVVARLLALGADVGLQSARGSFATHWACCGNRRSSLALLLDAGASMTVYNDHEQTPLMVAAGTGATDCVTLLLARLGDGAGEELGTVDNDGDSAAHIACYFNHSWTLALLLDAGASMDARNNHGRTPLMVAAANGATDCVTLLLARSGDDVGEQLGMVDNEGDSAAHLACIFKQPSSLALLLDAGASMDARKTRGHTPLMVAAAQGANACVTLLLGRCGNGVGQQLRMVDEDGNSAAHLASRFKHASMLALLLDAGAPMDARGYHNHTPIMAAAVEGATVCVTLLLARFGDEAGQQLGMVDDDGNSAAHYACYFNQPSTLALLLDAGASMTARGNHGRTPLMAAAVHGATDSMTLLLDKGVHGLGLDAKQDGDRTALHLATYHGYHQVVSLLLHAGADPTIYDDVGQTALDDAQARGHQECAALLEAALVEPQRSRLLFKARALLDAAHATHKARTDAQTKGHSAAVQEQEAMAAAPVYLKQRVAQAQVLPRVSIQHDDNSDEELKKLAACLKYALGLEGGGGVCWSGRRSRRWGCCRRCLWSCWSCWCRSGTRRRRGGRSGWRAGCRHQGV